ncbi:MAG: 4-hydroxybenzoate 3-monooxygenase, partial [Acetobacteraceae bacterium]
VGVGARLHREGIPHHGVRLRFDGRDHRIDFAALTGRHVMVYSQHKIVQDLIAARLDAGGRILFEAEALAPLGFDAAPRIAFRHDGREQELTCDMIAGCDGFHGVCRPAIEADLHVFEREYPFGWLGILAETPPSSEELIYASHARGFALLSMRSPTVTRLYLQCAPDEDLSAWPNSRVWDELDTRTECAGFTLNRGKVLQKGVTPMRSFVVEPMQSGRMFLLGDAAHIVPPTGAKGLNLAAADVFVLARALEAYFKRGRSDLLEAYSATCLARVWKVQRFSWWMTSMLHRFATYSPFEQRVQVAELAYLAGSEAASRALAENYVGLPL